MKTNLYNLKVRMKTAVSMAICPDNIQQARNQFFTPSPMFYSNVEIVWQVVSVHYEFENGSTTPIIDNVLFEGTISDCYAFILLKNNRLLLET